jgi:hypothetical protein
LDGPAPSGEKLMNIFGEKAGSFDITYSPDVSEIVASY